MRYQALIASLSLSACVGQIRPTGAQPSGPSGPAGAAAGPGSAGLGSAGLGSAGQTGALCSTPAVGPTPLRRLTRREFSNTVTDLFGQVTLSDADLPDDSADSLGFVTTTGQPLSPESTLKYFDVATSIGGVLAARLPALFPCAPATAEADCVTAFLQTTGTKMFRRPLTSDEQATFSAVFAKARAGEATGDEAALALVQTMIVTPQFLFILEPAGGAGGPPRALDSWQIATRLSYLLWQTTPDATLMDAAGRDELRSKDAVAAHARRMLASPRARAPIAAFFDDWLALREIEKAQKDPKTFPDVTAPVLKALAQESRLYVEDLFWNQNGAFDKLLISPTRVRNKMLSQFYGDALGQADDPQLVPGPVDDKTFGLLSQAGFLMGISRNDGDATIFRGKFIRTKLLCQPIFLPPPGVATPLPAIQPGVTSRQRVEMHTSAGVCAACHNQMNPFGYALEHFDGAGRWRDTEGGLTIDTAAEVTSSDLGPFDGARDLSVKLAGSAMVRQCVVSQMFQYAMRRQATGDDQCGMTALNDKFTASQLSLKELLMDITQSDAFFARVEPKE
jgi:hypothetical protein